MKKWTELRAIAFLLIFALAMSTFTGFAYYDGFGTVYYESNQEIFKDTVYTETIGNNPTYGMEHSYSVTTDLDKDKLVPLVYSGEATACYTVGDMIKFAENEGYKVVAAINGDIYDTASGIPKNPVIHSGNIVTSGYAQDRVIAFDNDSNAFMAYAGLNYKFKGMVQYEMQQQVTIPEATSENVTSDASITAPVTTNTVNPETVMVQQEITNRIGYFNVPFGASKSLHLFNRHYASSTRTSGNCVEVVIECDVNTGSQLKVNGTVKGKIVSINLNTSNTPIGDNQLVLSTVSDSASAGILSQLVVGSDMEVSVEDTAGSNLAIAKEAVGIYYSLLENGNVVTTGKKGDPRTAFGIKADGSVVIYEVDGRQANNSMGLSLIDVAKHMKEKGCINAFNMDGGGSSVFYVRLPGQENTATLKSTPSQLNQRKVSNVILFAYKNSADSTAQNLHVYPALTLAMPGAQVPLQTYATNSLYEKVSLPAPVTYSVGTNDGIISGASIFIAGEKAGKVKVNATSNGLSGYTDVEIVEDFTFTPSVQKLYLEKNQQSAINITVKVGTMSVKSQNSLFKWSCDENIGTVDQNGVFVAGNNIAQQGNIYVEYKDKKVTIPVQVGPMTIDFSDTYGHWANKYIGTLAARGVLSGIGDNMFAPEANVTRAQFLAMLAKTVYDLDITKSAPAGFKDVPESEWFYNYVNWGSQNGIVNGVSEAEFAPNANITREQMTIMLCNFANSQGIVLPQSGTIPVFIDKGSISPWATDYVITVAGAGIINGQPDGSFQPQGNATRAQAAKVMYVFCNIKDGISN